MFAGERFVLDLDDPTPDLSHPTVPDPSLSSIASPSLGLIGEIRERHPATAPAPPKPPSGTTGFPQHKQRIRQSAFKQQRFQKQSAAPSTPAAPTSPAPSTSLQPATLEDEKRAIDEENKQRLAAMSPSQIEEERVELMSSIDPSLLQRFLRRARIDDDDEDNWPVQQTSAEEEQRQPEEGKGVPKKSVSFDILETPVAKSLPDPATTKINPVSEDLPPAHPPQDLHPASEFPSHASFHFPTPPPRQNPMPNLDPSSPSFLSDLQTHYFPDLPHDPSLISWLQPPRADPEDPESSLSAYHPASSAVSVAPAFIRFSLIGTILSPSTSLSLPTSLGLHHHGDDPHAAGYTIPELAILSRSSFPAQRCIAWQVLGRILFRLGKGQFGERGSTLVEGLWSVIEREAVIAGMLAEADGGSSSNPYHIKTGAEKDTDKDKGSMQNNSSAKEGGVAIGKHASAKAWAVEGVWLWQMGGGGDRGLLKEGAVRSQ
ncbi:hypothetical protein MPDQ_000353 [Monascus purpureus]|uniref:Transcription factor Rba50 n=1 Tax=Monascus purpureus TaxID=5098 RepID=A0A507QPZ2_MONPU|nr:hypothetical protein MPDQ_000353 [Monascus purpureus]BDD63285.1 hypothetical protein MAP00_008198 [Monascus purpureus]